MRNSRMVAALAVLSIGIAGGAKKKNKEEVTQALELPKDPPALATGAARRLVFGVSPLSGKGLLSQQTRDALRLLLNQNGKSAVVHVRAFVAGSGDIRRVPQIVSDVFSEKKMPLPAVSVVLAGALPMENAQVVLETVSLAKKDVNPDGVQFFAGDRFTDPDPVGPAGPLLGKALDALAAGLKGAPALRVSCFVSNLSDPAAMNSAISSKFPSAAVNLVQPVRLPFQASAQCEAVARGGANAAAQVGFTGTRVAFGSQEKDANLAWQRLDRDLKEAGASPDNLLFGHVYELRPAVADMARKMRTGAHPVASIPVEGLASIDAGFAVDAVAVIHK